MRRKVLLILLCLVLAFIWLQSCLSTADSREESLSVLKFLRPLLELVLGKERVTLHLVRKMAHFCEFFILGCLLSLLLPLQLPMRALACGLGLLAGFIDETIQAFSDRGDAIGDVWLDFSGAFAGILLTTLILLILRRRRQMDSPALK